jgi:hypothetical protein
MNAITIRTSLFVIFFSSRPEGREDRMKQESETPGIAKRTAGNESGDGDSFTPWIETISGRESDFSCEAFPDQQKLVCQLNRGGNR